MNKKDKGFTLVELLVVVAVIGVIAGMVLPALSSARKKGKVTHFVSELQQIEKAFMLTYLEEDRNTWWTESEIGITNPTLQQIINKTSGPLANFSNYLRVTPSNLINSSQYKYDNDNDTDDSCENGGVENDGVSLFISDLDYPTALEVDKYIDHVQHYACGQIRYKPTPDPGNTTHLIFELGSNSKDF
jgi:prepilin-type N-terminal cleavage/methylation domain-containing protein